MVRQKIVMKSSEFHLGPSRLYMDSLENLQKSRGKVGLFHVVLRFFRFRICENIRGGLADNFGPVYSSGDQNLTDFVLIFNFVPEDVCLCFIVFPAFCYQAGLLAPQDPSQTKDLEILIYRVVLKH